MARNLGLLALVSLSVAGSASQAIRTTVDDILVNFADVQPVMVSGRVMVPVRGVFEHMNAEVEWNADTRTVTAQRGNDNIILPINSRFATVNGRQVSLDAPARIRNGRTIVPLRFLSESLGASVEWIADSRLVEINTTTSGSTPPTGDGATTRRIDEGTVIPFGLVEKLSSNGSEVGDKFTANLDTAGNKDYQGMPTGAVLEGHVDVARAKSGETPGVLGLAFDRIRMADGQTYPVYGSLIGLDSKSVEYDDGRIIARKDAKTDNLKYVGYGAGGGALLAILTNGNIITNSLIGGALGYLFGEIQKNPEKSNNVTQQPGTKFGMKLTRDLTFRVAAANQR